MKTEEVHLNVDKNIEAFSIKYKHNKNSSPKCNS